MGFLNDSVEWVCNHPFLAGGLVAGAVVSGGLGLAFSGVLLPTAASLASLGATATIINMTKPALFRKAWELIEEHVRDHLKDKLKDRLREEITGRRKVTVQELVARVPASNWKAGVVILLAVAIGGTVLYFTPLATTAFWLGVPKTVLPAVHAVFPLVVA